MAGKTILYVEDEEDLRIVVSACLEDEGYEVLLAENAAEGLQLATSRFPDLILTDAMMPDESGFSLCKKLKADPSTKDIPVIFLTVMDEEKTALEAGASGFLNKPFDDDELIQTVKTHLRPGDTRAILEHALALLRSGQTDAAMGKLEEVVKTDEGGTVIPWARYYIGQIEQQRSDHDKAEATFHQILKDDPSFYRAHNRLGQVSEAKGDFERAQRHYERSLSLNAAQDDIQKKLDSLRNRY